VASQIVLDDAAEELFRELGGTDTRKGASGVDLSGLAESLHQQDKKTDPWRLLIVEYTCDLAGFIDAWRKGNLREAENAVKKLDAAIGKLCKMPEHGGQALVRHQGRGIPGEGRAAMDYDYSVSFGPITIDIPAIRAAAARIGYSATRFPGDFTRALSILAEARINCIRLAVQEQTREYNAQLGAAFTALGPYLRLLSSEAAMARYGGKDSKQLPVVYDEFHAPDPNLTLLASVNKQKRADVQALVAKVHSMRSKPELKQAMENYPTAYETIFGIKKLREQLNRPLMEINNVSSLVARAGAEALSREQALVARLALRIFGKDNQALARFLDCMYSLDFRFQNPYQVVERLGFATEVLRVIEKNLPREAAPRAALQHPAVRHILECGREKMDKLSDEILEDIEIGGTEARVKISAEESIRRPVHPALLEIVAFFRQRAATRKKIKSMLQEKARFTDLDYATVARDFGVEIAGAKEILALIKGCFDPGGHFIRRVFEKKIPDFCKYEDKVFEFLWHFLKEHMHSHERIGFLNSLKVMIDKMKQTNRALEVLLADFAHDPEKVTFSDRNALMLCNALLRSFNKELHQDIEMTPEEVLNVKQGLDQGAVEFSREYIDREKEKFYNKFRAIHRELRRALEGGKDIMPVRYLLTLEREAYMLFALVGGITGLAILRSGLNEYGDPEADIYHMDQSKDQVSWLLQILQVLVRAISRAGDKEDVQTLHEIRPRETRFFNLSQDQRHVDQVRRMYRWIDTAEQDLKKANAK
jgi:plasmid stabilization system protein ParE